MPDLLRRPARFLRNLPLAFVRTCRPGRYADPMDRYRTAAFAVFEDYLAELADDDAALAERFGWETVLVWDEHEVTDPALVGQPTYQAEAARDLAAVAAHLRMSRPALVRLDHETNGFAYPDAVRAAATGAASGRSPLHPFLHHAPAIRAVDEAYVSPGGNTGTYEDHVAEAEAWAEQLAPACDEIGLPPPGPASRETFDLMHESRLRIAGKIDVSDVLTDIDGHHLRLLAARWTSMWT